MPDKLTFEEALAKLESTVDKIRTGNCSLQESIALYEESVKYYEVCEAILKEAKQKIELYKPQTGTTEAYDEH